MRLSERVDYIKSLISMSLDHRTKGFSEGSFQSESIRSIYSLSKNNITEDLFLDFCRTEQSCISIELLAKYTTFFGQKMNGSASDIFKNKDVLFVAALMLYTYHISHKNIVNVSSFIKQLFTCNLSKIKSYLCYLHLVVQ